MASLVVTTACRTRTFQEASRTKDTSVTTPTATDPAPAMPGLSPNIRTRAEYDAMLDKTFAAMERNRTLFWSAAFVKARYGVVDAAKGDAYFDNEGEKVAWDAVQRCVQNNSSSATGGQALSDLSHHYYCTLPGYMPDKKVNAAAGGPEESPLGTIDASGKPKKKMSDDEYRAWRTRMVNHPLARQWLHSGIRACFTYSLRGQLLQLDRKLFAAGTPKTQFVRRTELTVPDAAAAGGTRLMSAPEHAAAYCLNDGRAANPEEIAVLTGLGGLDDDGKPFTPPSYVSKAKYLVAKEPTGPRPFEWLLADQGEVFQFAMLQHPTTADLQRRLNAFYRVDGAEALTAGACAADAAACDTVKRACVEKRPARRPELEPQDGLHCRLDRPESTGNEQGNDDAG